LNPYANPKTVASAPAVVLNPSSAVLSTLASVTDPSTRNALRIVAQTLTQVAQTSASAVEATAAATTAQIPTYQQIRVQLQAGGTQPLILSGLPGSIVLLSGTHAARPVAGSTTLQTLYYETDRQYLFACIQVGGANAWVYVAGQSRDVVSALWGDLGANDIGALYLATDQEWIYEWSGTAWAYIAGTFASAVANLPAAATSNTGALFFATDTFAFYVSSGSVWHEYRGSVLYTPSWTPNAVAANTSATQTLSVTGLATTDTVAVNPPGVQAGTGIVAAWVSSADTLSVTFANFTTESLTPTSGTYRVMAFRA